MRKSVLLGVLFMLQVALHAHNMNYSMPALRKWTNTVTGEQLQGSFLIQKNDGVLVQDSDGSPHAFPLNSLSAADQQWLAQRSQWIQSVNAQILAKENCANENDTNVNYLWVFYLIVAALLGALLFTRMKSLRPIVWPAILVMLGFTWSGFTQWKDQQLEMDTDPVVINEAFNPFVPAVHTFFDTDYFYVESRGIPETHEMMVGISNHGWQQQVPIPQCYIGNNSWPIPLHPVMAADPIPVDSIHFTRGAIAIAVNGVPIFNVYTNTGADSFVDGQLDTYGGHCGRADDYHYHIAPLHLYDYTSSSLPIAYGLDGFAVYGSTEPDGSPMQPLDANHGHFGADGVYHYHGTVESPYMIARMAGEVTEDTTHQLIPQAAAHPVRPSLNPLNGALINMCAPNAAGNGYTLGYLLNGQQDSIAYSWDNSGNYSFNYYTTGDGVANTQVYTGFDQCIVPVNVHESDKPYIVFEVFPNPCSNVVQVKIISGTCNEVRVYSADGKCLKKYLPNQLHNGAVDMSDCPQGNYYFECVSSNGTAVQKVIKL